MKRRQAIRKAQLHRSPRKVTLNDPGSVAKNKHEIILNGALEPARSSKKVAKTFAIQNLI